eukprot:gene19437-biopygen17501
MLWSRFPYSHKNDYSPFYSHENRGTTPSPAKRQRPRGGQVHPVPAGPTKLPPRTAPFVRGGPRCVQNWNGSKPPAAEDILLYSGATCGGVAVANCGHLWGYLSVLDGVNFGGPAFLWISSYTPRSVRVRCRFSQGETTRAERAGCVPWGKRPDDRPKSFFIDRGIFLDLVLYRPAARNATLGIGLPEHRRNQKNAGGEHFNKKHKGLCCLSRNIAVMCLGTVVACSEHCPALAAVCEVGGPRAPRVRFVLVTTRLVSAMKHIRPTSHNNNTSTGFCNAFTQESLTRFSWALTRFCWTLAHLSWTLTRFSWVLLRQCHALLALTCFCWAPPTPPSDARMNRPHALAPVGPGFLPAPPPTPRAGLDRLLPPLRLGVTTGPHPLGRP